MRRNLIPHLLAAAMLVLLAACSSSIGGGGALELQSTATIELDSNNMSTTVILQNTAAHALTWGVEVRGGHVTVAPPTKGTLSANGQAPVTLLFDQSGLREGQSGNATVTFTSSDGDAAISVQYAMTVAGLDQCGVATSPAAASTITTHRGTSDAVAAPRHVEAANTPTSGAARPAVRDALGRAYVPGEVLVAYRADTGRVTATSAGQRRQVAAAVLQDHAVQLLRAGAPGEPDLVRVAPADDAVAASAALARDPRVLYAQPNYYLQPLAVTPNDTFYGDEWNMSQFGMPQAWTIETGASHRTVIAIIDSGVMLGHEDLAAKMLPGCDLHDGDALASPDVISEHGTHVAGIAAAIGNNGVGIAGAAYGSRARILPVKVFDNFGGNATVDDLVRGILWAAGLDVSGVHRNPNPADVINMSLGVSGDQPALDDAARRAWASGSLLIAAAGNHATGAVDDAVMSPANSPDVIAVASVDSDYTRSSFSNTGSAVELAAPGGRLVNRTNICHDPTGTNPSYPSTIVSTYPYDEGTAGNYGCEEGTSMAAPFVAGVAALLKSHDPTLTNQQIRDLLDATALFDSAIMNRNGVGHGVVCADKALGAATRCGR